MDPYFGNLEEPRHWDEASMPQPTSSSDAPMASAFPAPSCAWLFQGWFVRREAGIAIAMAISRASEKGVTATEGERCVSTGDPSTPVAEWIHFHTFCDNTTHYKIESVHFFGADELGN